MPKYHAKPTLIKSFSFTGEKPIAVWTEFNELTKFHNRSELLVKILADFIKSMQGETQADTQANINKYMG